MFCAGPHTPHPVAAAAAGDTALAVDAGDWTHILQTSTDDSRDVEAEVIAACGSLSDRPVNFTSARQQPPTPRSNADRSPAQPANSNSEICVAQVLASLSSNSQPQPVPQVPAATSSDALAGKNTSSVRRRRQPASARKTDKRNSRSSNCHNETDVQTHRTTEMSTINMSEFNGLSFGKNSSSSGAETSVNTVSVRDAASSAVSSSSSVSPSTTVASCMTSSDSSKHCFFRPMKQATEVTIVYDETSKRHIQRVKTAADRRKSLGFPGYQSAIGDADALCRSSLPASVVVNTKENAETELRCNSQHRLSLTRETITSMPSLLMTSEVSSSTRVAAVCVDKSAEELLQRLQDISSAVSAGSRRPRNTGRKSSLPAGKVLKCSAVDSGPLLLTSVSGTADVVSPAVLVPSCSTQKNSSKSKRSADTKKSTEKGRPTGKKSGTAPRRTSPRRSEVATAAVTDCLVAEVTAKKKRQPKAGKPTKTAKEKVVKPKQTRTSKKQVKNCVVSPAKSPIFVDLTSPAVKPGKRKRSSSPHMADDKKTSLQQLTVNHVVQLPDIKCFLNVQTNDTVQVETGTAVDPCKSRTTGETSSDDHVHQNGFAEVTPSVTQSETLSISLVDPPLYEEQHGDTSTQPQIIVQTASSVSSPSPEDATLRSLHPKSTLTELTSPSDQVCSSDNVLQSSVVDLTRDSPVSLSSAGSHDTAVVSTLCQQEGRYDVTSGQTESSSGKTHVVVPNSTPPSG